MYAVIVWDRHPLEYGAVDVEYHENLTFDQAKGLIANSSYTEEGYWVSLVYVQGFIETEHELHKPTDVAVQQRKHRERREDEADRREYAMQMGMGLGIDAYNDAIGSSLNKE